MLASLSRARVVRDSFHRAATFLDRFLGPVKVEQAKVGQPWRHDQVGGSPAMRLRAIRTCMMLMLEANTSSRDGIVGSSGGCAGISTPRLSCSLRIQSPTTPARRLGLEDQRAGDAQDVRAEIDRDQNVGAHRAASDTGTGLTSPPSTSTIPSCSTGANNPGTAIEARTASSGRATAQPDFRSGVQRRRDGGEGHG